MITDRNARGVRISKIPVLWVTAVLLKGRVHIRSDSCTWWIIKRAFYPIEEMSLPTFIDKLRRIINYFIRRGNYTKMEKNIRVAIRNKKLAAYNVPDD